MKIKFIFVLLCAGLLMVSCGGKKAHKSDAAIALSGNVSSVTVVIDKNTVPADRLEAIETHNVVSRLQNGVTELLQSRGKYAADGTVQVAIRVTDFRLRSGASAFWLGAMAGSDFTSVDVEVTEQGKQTRHFSTDASTAMGGMIAPSPSQRVNKVCTEVSNRIVKQL